jgi:SAM-dependent methyltransferase
MISILKSNNDGSAPNPGIDDVDRGQWPAVAPVWKQLASPLRPVEADLGFIRKAVSLFGLTVDLPPRVLIMGVTPEVYHLPWPDGSSVRAIDWTPRMIENVWPGPREHVTLGDWREMDFAPRTFNIVTCDGGIHTLDYPAGQRKTFCHLARIVAPGGLFITRLFVPPAIRETPAKVLDDLFANRIPDLNCLKLRLGMAIQNDPREGAALRQVWQTLREATPDWPTLADRLNWPLDHLLAIDAYRDTDARYFFVPEKELTAMLCEDSGWFEFVSAETPTYEMGAQCPTVIYRRTTRD